VHAYAIKPREDSSCGCFEPAFRAASALLRDVVSQGKVDGNDLILSDDVYQRLRAKYADYRPSRLVGFVRALMAWSRSGFALATSAWLGSDGDLQSMRVSQSPVENPLLRSMWLTDLKPWLGTSRCPIGRWPE